MKTTLSDIEHKYLEFLKYARLLDDDNKERIKPKVKKNGIELSSMLHEFIGSW